MNNNIDPYTLQIGSEITVSEESSVEVFHTVEPGETLWSIANLHKDVTLTDLYNWNPDIDPLALQIGSEVRVQPPENTDGNPTDEEFYTVKAGDTLSEIAAKYEGVSVENLFSWNPEVEEYALQIGSKLRVQPSDNNAGDGDTPAGWHTVEPGETLWSIANLHANTTLEELYEWNPDVDPYNLQPGMEVRVQDE